MINGPRVGRQDMVPLRGVAWVWRDCPLAGCGAIISHYMAGKRVVTETPLVARLRALLARRQAGAPQATTHLSEQLRAALHRLVREECAPRPAADDEEERP